MGRRVTSSGQRAGGKLIAGAWASVALALLVGCERVDYVLGSRAGSGQAAGAAGADAGAEPVLARRIDLSSGGPNTRVLLGDVTGDGRIELVTMQPDPLEDDRHEPHEVVCLTAFDLTGETVWQIGTPDPSVQPSATDIPAQIYDLDGDGYNEVLAVMSGRFRVFDGRTGDPEYDFALPHPDAHDAIVIANFSGHARPTNLVLKDRYAELWALDRFGNPLFGYVGNVGHYPWPHDWDADGRDELMAGCDYLEDDGTLQWSCSEVIDGSPDAVFAGDVDQDPSNGAEVLVGGGNTLLYDRHGNLLWQYDTVESQNVALGQFRPDVPGLEIAGLDRVSRTADGYDRMFLLSADGEALWIEDRLPGSGWTTIVTMLSNWDGGGTDLITSYRRAGAPPTLYDGYQRAVATFRDPDAHLLHADLCGDDREEVILYTDSYADVYAAGPCDVSAAVTGSPRPQTKRLYNSTRYWGGEYP